MEDDSCLDDLDASLFDDSSTTAIAATTTRRILETAQQPASSPRQSECGGGGPAVPTTPTESGMFTPACTAAPTLDIPFPEGLAARNKHNNNYGDDEDSGEEDASALSSRGRRRPQNPVAPPPPPPPPRPSQNPMDRFSFVAKKKASLCSEALDRNNRRGMTPAVNNTPKAAARASPGLICSPPENTRLAAPTTAPATATATATATAVQQQQQHGGWEESSMSHTTAGSTVYTQIAVAVAASIKSAVRGGAHGATRGSNGGDSSSKVAIQEELPAHPPTPPPRPSLDMHSGGSFSYATTFAAKFKAQQSNPGSRSSKIAATTSASPSLASVKENVGDEESLRTLSSALLTSAVLGSTWQSGASAVDEIAKEKGQEEEEEEEEEEGDADDGGGGGGYDNVVGEDDEAVVILDQPADFAIESDDRDSGSSSNGLGALQLQSPTPAHILHDSKQSSPSLTRAKVQCLKKRSWLATLRDAGSSATIIDKSG